MQAKGFSEWETGTGQKEADLSTFICRGIGLAFAGLWKVVGGKRKRADRKCTIAPDHGHEVGGGARPSRADCRDSCSARIFGKLGSNRQLAPGFAGAMLVPIPGIGIAADPWGSRTVETAAERCSGLAWRA